MTTFTRYDPAEGVAEGRTVIEASAGTGKTYAVAAQVTRLISDGVPIERILAVTFTRAATAELRDRIRQRFVLTLGALAGAAVEADDPHLEVLLDAPSDARVLSVDHLSEALTRFDRAQIFTIDGFAHRLLTQLGFRSRIPPGLEPSSIDDVIVRGGVADLTVARFADDATEAPSARALHTIAQTVTTNPDALIVPDPATVTGQPRIRAEMAHDLRHHLNRRLRDAGAIAYDGFLIEARDALTDPVIGAEARRVLQERFSVALVDECQDTDPIQWQIISAVFEEQRLVIIGDPKQSIYAFRGADVESYLGAVDRATTPRTLVRNWRSDGPLITALDAVFEGATFGDARIRYHRVEPAAGNAHARLAGLGAPLIIRHLSPRLPISRRKSGARTFLKQPVRQTAAADAAAEAVRILTSGARIETDETDRPIGPGDIAVLCRTRNQVQLVQAELDLRDVPSVAARSGSVFASDAAEQWRRLLRGVERPDRTAYVRLAVTSDLVGLSLADLAGIDDDSVIELQQRMRAWRDLLHESGVPALVADLDRTTKLGARVLGRRDGERFMTDFNHVAEVMHNVWRRGRVGSLLDWLEDAMAEAAANTEANVEEPESRQRRLETDAEAVQVQTIHASKGLEYPIVLCPFLWDQVKPPSSAEKVPVFHDPAGTVGARRRLVDVGGGEAPDFGEHCRLSSEEEADEEGRLLYVAMTRARHRLVVWWADDAPGVAETKLHDLMTRCGQDITWLADRSAATIEVELVDAMPIVEQYQPGDRSVPELALARLERRLDYQWRRVSFSSLSPDHPVEAVTETSEEPRRSDEPPDDDPEPGHSVPLPMAGLPRGARFGTLVHHILENVRFDAPDLEAAVRAATSNELRRSSWELDADALSSGLVAAIETPLGPEPGAVRLRDIPDRRSLSEMAFELPVRTDGPAMSLRDVAAAMLEHLPEDDPHREYAAGLAELPEAAFRGYLTGFIDYTAAVPAPGGPDRFVIMDFKSNTLVPHGDEPASTDYAASLLRAVMEDSHYLLQAVFYQVALHRYLQWRLPDYEPATHLGGSAYLFVRGMIGSNTAVVDGERCGVYRWAPPPELIVDLSARFAGDEP